MRENKLTNKEIKIEFAPGCFDDFEGTQEQLDEIVAEIHKMAASGEILEGSEVDFEDLDDFEGEPTVIIDVLVNDITEKRRLH